MPISIGVLASAITFVLFVPFAMMGVDIHHDGVPLKAAIDVASGSVIFKETFSQYGALTAWIHAGFVKAFGPGLFSIRLATVVAYAGTAFFLTRFWGLFLSKGWVWVGLALFWILPPFYTSEVVFLAWPSVIALFFQSGVAFYLGRYLSQGKRSGNSGDRDLWMAGGFSGLCFWARNPVGTVLILACLIALIFARRGLVKYTSGLILGVVVPWLVLFYQGAHQDWILQNWVWPRAWAQSKDGFNLERVLHYLVRHRNQAIFQLSVLILSGLLLRKFRHKVLPWFLGAVVFLRVGFEPWAYTSGIYSAIPLFGIFLFAYKLLKSKGEIFSNGKEPLLVFMLMITGSTWAQFYPVNDARHVYWALAPVWGIFLYWLKLWFDHVNPAAVRAMVSVFIISLVLHQGVAAAQKWMRPLGKIDHPAFKWISIEPHIADGFAPLVEYLTLLKKSEGDRPILLEGPDPLYACLSEKTLHPHTMPMVWEHNDKVEGMIQTQFTPVGVDFIHRERPWIIVQQVEQSGSAHNFLSSAASNYKKEKWIKDPTRGVEVSLWVWR